MKLVRGLTLTFMVCVAACSFGGSVQAALTLTAGSNATTTPNVATSISGFQIVGPAASTTPVKLRTTSGTMNLSSVGGVTMSGNGSASVSLSGAVSALNAALATLTYTRASTGTDTLEVSLVEAGEVFFEDNGHLYKYISDTTTWGQAQTRAQALTLYGATGYLTTITSANENSFVSARLLGAGWMGASDVSSEGVWQWVAGPENGTQFWSGASGGSTVSGRYANWNSGEPNDSSGNEDCAQFLAGGTGKWNDLPCSGTTLAGYVAEFGADGNMPLVVAQNISIVTADVPALTTLSPLNAAVSVSPTANLVISFSKSVTVGTGNILIRNASDDSVVATIDVAGGLLSGSGTNTITINPAEALPEGTQFYVTVPNTAFKDNADNFFAGITDDSTWTFTTSDVTAPVISNLASAVATSTADISWNTNESASTRIRYSTDDSYSTATSETNTGTRVTSHAVSLTNLLACTLYHYKAVSRDATGNTATSTASTFTTTGCPGGTPPTSSTSTPVTVNQAATSTLAESGRTLTVETPADFTATSSTVVIQIKSMVSDTVLGVIGTPSASLESAAAIVFDVTALIDNTTVLDSFDVPVTISYQYTDEDIAGLDEGTLSMYHYRDSAWTELDACSTDTGLNTITCTAPHFSVFAIFGSPPAGSTGSSRSSGASIQSRVKNLAGMGKVAEAEALKSEWHWLFPQTALASSGSTSSVLSVRDLELGMTGEDVRSLQKLLNANGFVLAESGVGSPGNETEYFGTLTQSAVSAYQSANQVAPSIGYFGPLTRNSMKTVGWMGLWW